MPLRKIQASSHSRLEEILRKRVSAQIFRCIAQKFAEMEFSENTPIRELAEKNPALHALW